MGKYINVFPFSLIHQHSLKAKKTAGKSQKQSKSILNKENQFSTNMSSSLYLYLQGRGTKAKTKYKNLNEEKSPS